MKIRKTIIISKDELKDIIIKHLSKYPITKDDIEFVIRQRWEESGYFSHNVSYVDGCEITYDKEEEE